MAQIGLRRKPFFLHVAWHCVLSYINSLENKQQIHLFFLWIKHRKWPHKPRGENTIVSSHFWENKCHTCTLQTGRSWFSCLSIQNISIPILNRIQTRWSQTTWTKQRNRYVSLGTHDTTATLYADSVCLTFYVNT